jgi:hypothetical protein
MLGGVDFFINYRQQAIHLKGEFLKQETMILGANFAKALKLWQRSSH